MRWVPFILLAYVMVLLQSTLGGIITFTATPLGTIGPDLVAIVAVFVVLNVRSASTAMLAAWVLGLGLDLTTATAPGCATAVGPMAIAYALAGGLVFHIREAFYHTRPIPQGLLTLVFCLVAHLLWVTAQTLLAPVTVLWLWYGQMVLQAVVLSAYTAVLAPFGHVGLRRIERWLIVGPVGRRARRGRA